MSAVLDLSLVIPSYNSAQWLPSTIASIQDALARCSLRSEIVVVDDGSTDDTAAVLAVLAAASDVVIRVVTTVNQGVFEAVRTGALKSHSERVLIVNSRLLVDREAFAYLETQMAQEGGVTARNGHVATSDEVPLVGRFWEVPTHVFWGTYLRKPVLTPITLENFDTVPKGTGFFVVGRERLLAAYDAIGDPGTRFVSDDTKLMRHIAASEPILLDPEFRATYRPRTTVQKFLSHGFLRGTLFVDSYYGTSLVRSLMLWVVALSVPAAAAVLVFSAFAGKPLLVLVLLLLFVLVVAGMVVASAINRAPWRAVVSFVTYIIPFAGVFWAGVTRGLWIRLRARNT